VAVNFVTDVDNWVPVKRVLLSVSDKSGLGMLVPRLLDLVPDIQLLSTGGTYAHLAEILGDRAGAHLIQVSDYTGQPETQGGLVKTLDFKIYLGLLTETYNDSHRADRERVGAAPIDMIVVNLYPFADTVARPGATVEMARANIDIGGPTMVRAAAKNYLRVASVVDPGDYDILLEQLHVGEGRLNLEQRFAYARKAFAHTAAYDTAIGEYLGAQDPAAVRDLYTRRDES
jgi:phosphoribosylaminoimidazolecarboxamide formyltransferase / IMP cyclohydrolase